MSKLKLLIIVLAIVFFPISCKQKAENNYLKKWNNFESDLITTVKSFQAYEEFDSLRGDLKLITYTSEDYEHKGLLNIKNIDSLSQKPVIVYLHGGFALSYREMDRTKIFTDAGYIVFAPTYRGENGNQGYFELFMGEVRDAKAAINWISGQKFTDSSNIYVFGWSVGGGISLNLSLHDDIPVKLGASSAGIYYNDLIKSWATEDDMIVFPYDYTNKNENYYRLPIYNLQHMTRPHSTYIGKEDGYFFVESLRDSLYPENTTKLELIPLDGDHVSSLEKAMTAFLHKIENN